ncbi:vacuolar amino acid permease [Neolentinus lepideus HHB14362 ss-1]|uniref:Vacuolar amino acid permease n=1 Tax=Neolentinus lepideus HHB14362 ss-1 TaxID=1314782 RepID=A0A165TPQ4_9AGAM|nr:vacuolar amino acid permease [Neolentinus lepideus HHB14362 ss-1]
MSFNRKSDSEARPLLDDRRSSYGSADTENTTVPDVPLNKVSRSDLIWILAGLWSAVFLGALDGTIVATLLTPIGSYFNKANQASYIGTSYLLSVCCFTPLYGRLSDILGRRGAMLLGLFFFGTGTLLCGLANSMETLIAARAIAGMGGGGVMTVSSVAVTDLIPLKQRGLYQGMCNILFGLGAGLGGPLGGWLNDAFGWRSAFILQMPVLAFSVILVIMKVKIKLPFDVQNQSTSAKLKRIDFFGSFTLVGTVGCLLLGFSLKSTEELSWSHPLIWGLFLVSAVFGVAFVLVEHYWSPYPIMPLRLITQRTPLAVSLSNFFGSVAAFSMLYNIPLYFSAVRLNSSTQSGLHLLPHSVALSTGSVFAGWIMRRTGKLYTLTLCSAGSAILASALVCLWGDGTSNFHLWFDIVPQGFGMASLITSTLIAMIAGVVKEDMAVATGITYLFRTTGQVLGVSLSGAILQAVLVNKLRARIHGPNAAEIIENIRHSVNIIPSLDADLRHAAVSSYQDALQVVFICQLAMNVLTFICCFAIQENPLPGTHEEQEEQYRNNASRNGTSVEGQ